MKPRYTAVIILQYNNSHDTIDCIKSVELHNTAPIKYIVVDNGSNKEFVADETEKFLQSTFPGMCSVVDDTFAGGSALTQVTFVRSAVNDGYARGNNKGLRLAFADTEIDKILILNNDILFVEDIISAMAADLNRLDKCALVSPLLYKKDLKGTDFNCGRRQARVRDIFIYNMLLFRVPRFLKPSSHIPLGISSGCHTVELISGSCIICNKQLLESIGAFDPGTFLYYEENILWEKIKRLGLRNYVDTDLRCIHLGAATINSAFSAKLVKGAFASQRHFVRNYLPHGRLKAAILSLSNAWALMFFYVHDRLKNINHRRSLQTKQ